MRRAPFIETSSKNAGLLVHADAGDRRRGWICACGGPFWHAQGLADLLGYARPIEPGILLGKGGELIAGFFYRGTDTESASHGELEAIAARLNDILRQFGSGWMLHIDANRIPVLDAPEQSGFSSTIASLMDQERTRQYSQEGAHFESRYALILTYLPPLQVHSQANALMFDKSAELET